MSRYKWPTNIRLIPLLNTNTILQAQVCFGMIYKCISYTTASLSVSLYSIYCELIANKITFTGTLYFFMWTVERIWVCFINIAWFKPRRGKMKVYRCLEGLGNLNKVKSVRWWWNMVERQRDREKGNMRGGGGGGRGQSSFSWQTSAWSRGWCRAPPWDRKSTRLNSSHL